MANTRFSANAKQRILNATHNLYILEFGIFVSFFRGILQFSVGKIITNSGANASVVSQKKKVMNKNKYWLSEFFTFVP